MYCILGIVRFTLSPRTEGVDLLQNRNISELSLSERINSSKWLVRPILRLVQIEVNENRTLDYYFDYISNRLQRINSFSKTVKFEGHILVILSYNHSNDYEEISAQITNLLEKYELNAGVSRTFSNLSNLYTYYLQAKAALSLGKLLEDKLHLFYYKDFCFYHLLSSLDNHALNGLCSPYYEQLKQFDMENSTEYCETLYQYILSANSISMTAKALQIHRNTMAYRLEKISSISEINLSNGEELFQFYTTYKIMNWINK